MYEVKKKRIGSDELAVMTSGPSPPVCPPAAPPASEPVQSSSSSSSGKSGIPSPLIFTGLLSTRMMSGGSVIGGRSAGTSSQICAEEPAGSLLRCGSVVAANAMEGCAGLACLQSSPKPQACDFSAVRTSSNFSS